MQSPELITRDRPFERALVVVAHPDDAEFGVAGTVARWVREGTEVHYLVLTNGASGSSDPAMTRDRLAAIRREEQEAACEVLGVASLEWGGFEDGYLEPSIAARRLVAAAIRRHRPQVLVGMDPSTRYTMDGYINHPDHRAAGDLVLHCVNPAASTRLWDTTLLDEGLEPWDISELWLMGFSEGPHRSDISTTFDLKMAALRCHASQMPWGDPEDEVRQWATAVGEEVGVALAEPFVVLKQPQYGDEEEATAGTDPG